MYYLQLAFDLAFTSVEFVFFFIIVMLCIAATQKQLRLQNIFLLVASYLFYASWDPRFLGLILFSTFVDYWCGLKIYDSGNDLNKSLQAEANKESIEKQHYLRKKRKRFLTISMVCNLGLLFFFKYFNFFIDSLHTLFVNLNLPFDTQTLNIILPVGISFYTFQSMSYTIDIYRGKLTPTRSILNFSLYVAFFPQLVAGPIEKARDLLPQVEHKRIITKEKLSYGFYLAAWGLFKKLVVADNLSDIVNTYYGYNQLSGIDVWVGTLAFAFQIYADFSGYTDMARGVAKMMGFELSLNFNLPYFSKNLSEFWRRWHITLSSWIHEYVYISLGGNRKGKLLTYRNLFLSMTLSGLWHGAAWNFVVWGMFHAFFMSLVKLSEDIKPLSIFLSKVPPLIKVVVTFIITLYGWMLFRVESIAQALTYTKLMFTNFIADARTYEDLSIVLFYSSLIFIPQLFQYFSNDLDVFYKNYYVRASMLAVMLLLILIFGGSSAQEFIYFQF